MRDRLATVPATQVRDATAAVADRLAGIPALVAAPSVMVYVSCDPEIGTHDLIRRWLADGRRVCVPLFDESTHRYLASELKAFEDLATGKFGILEPPPGKARPLPIRSVQAFVVPGLAFDPTGNRLGRGRGYYDRILGEARGVKVALAYAFQLVDEVPVRHHDVGVDFLVTETQVVHCKRTDQ
jgi:5-formyltetrahydrofolate cyclo-ligase